MDKFWRWFGRIGIALVALVAAVVWLLDAPAPSVPAAPQTAAPSRDDSAFRNIK